MRMFILIIPLLVLSMSLPVKAGVLGINDAVGDILKTTATVLIIADWGTTLDIPNHDDIYETNRVIGRDPSRRHINSYFASKLAIHYLMNRYAPEYRNIWNIWQLGITYSAVENNMRLGLSLKF